MQFKPFVTTFMDLLEDADGMVRDTARNSVIVLFQYVNLPTFSASLLTYLGMHPMQQSLT